MINPNHLTLASSVRGSLVAAALYVVGGLLLAHSALATEMLGSPSCRFVVPEALSAHDVRWSGSCRAGLAQGLGTLRAYEDGRVTQVFYGSLNGGQPVLGVIEQDAGFLGGRFEAGKIVKDGERNSLIEAFKAAAAASGQIAEGYRRAGNAQSARYYQEKAKQLLLQLD